MAADLLPDSVVRRPKKMFRAPFAGTMLATEEPFVGQLLSEDSLRRAGYFEPRAVRHGLMQSRNGHRLRLTGLFRRNGGRGGLRDAALAPHLRGRHSLRIGVVGIPSSGFSRP